MWNKQLWYNFLENNSARHHEPKAFLENILKELGYDFCSKYSFNDLRTELGGKPIFDFAILDKSSIPFKPLMIIQFMSPRYLKNKNTQLKTDYCRTHNYPLLEIFPFDLQKQNFPGWLDSEIKRCLGRTKWFGETY